MSTGSPVHSLLTRPVSARPARPMIFNVEKWMRFIDCTLISANLINKEASRTNKQANKGEIFLQHGILVYVNGGEIPASGVNDSPVHIFNLSWREK